MKLLDVLNPFRKKKVEFESDYHGETSLPEELERFRIRREPSPMPPQDVSYPQVPYTPSPYSQPAEREVPKEFSKDMDKIDFVIQKLETIDARLKLIEERLRK